ncbi:hypothetical protein ABZS66_48595 [Dactylosporangium sp. NPDC005572]|uniref:hypothetical protein n=1 Tax=Dactylosporangium sp. NPDC005572 TaxID=3156889 RepID=UPI0033B0772C
MSGHLERLCLDGAGSTGFYTPHAFDLRLLGTELAADHVVYLHEVHHAVLNDATAWGGALHVYARLPGGGRETFGQLLDACRTTHESFATFSSVQIAAARHGPLGPMIAAYPRYVPLYQAVERLMALVVGPHRRQQATNALARLCMQTPIIDEILAAGLAGLRLAALRALDRPDDRWAWFLRRGPQLLAAAAQAADGAVTAGFGPAALGGDGPGSDLYTAAHRSHDDAWELWETAAYEHLRAALAAAGGRTLSFNGHQDGIARLVELVQRDHGFVGLRAEPGERRRSDADFAAAVLQQVRHDLTAGERHRAVAMSARRAEDLVDLLGDVPVAGGRPAMIVDARPTARLASLYRWAGRPPDSVAVAVRLFAEDDDGDVIGHVPLRDPAALAALAERWGKRGPFVLCVGASCLAEPGFAARWLPAAGPHRSIFVLVDVEPERFVPGWAGDGRTVVAVPLEVEDTAGRRGALLLTPDERVWWLIVADDVTVGLAIEYLRGVLGPALHVDGDADAGVFAAVREPALALITHVLATESFTSFDALEARHAD